MSLVVEESKIIDFGNKTISTANHINDGYCALVVVKGADTKVILRGNKGGVDAYSRVESFNSNNDYNIAVRVMEGAKVQIEGGVYKAGYETIYVNEGEVEILGGEFFAQFDGSRKSSNNIAPYELNLQDAKGLAGLAKIIVKGGRYIGFNPANNGSEPRQDGETPRNTNFVAEGYKVVEDGTYTFKNKDTQGVYIPTTEGCGWSMDADGNITCPVYKVVAE